MNEEISSYNRSAWLSVSVAESSSRVLIHSPPRRPLSSGQADQIPSYSAGFNIWASV